MYANVLGESWLGLHAAIRRLHEFDGALQATGLFEVRRGSNVLTRLMARMAGMPAAGTDVPVQLTVLVADAGEEWRRSFPAIHS